MALSVRENFLRNASMTGPEWMPTIVAVNDSTWAQYGKEVEDVLARHPILFPNFKKGVHHKLGTDPHGILAIDRQHTDNWGCIWHEHFAGMVGLVTECPLDDWSKFPGYHPPDPLHQDDWGKVDWVQIARTVAASKARGELTAGNTHHGFFFMRLYYLRGFENLMMDFATDEPQLHELIEMLVAYNRVIIQQYLRMGVDVFEAADDLGTQTASMINPTMFRQWITPAYKQLFQPLRAAGCHVSLHSDGHMIELIDELIDAGVTICNPQDLCNGIDEIKAAVDGRICIRLDIDRQRVVPFGTRREIRDLVEEGVRKLGSPRGGLELIVGVYPPTPPENIDALCCAFEEFRTYWFDGRGKA